METIALVGDVLELALLPTESTLWTPFNDQFAAIRSVVYFTVSHLDTTKTNHQHTYIPFLPQGGHNPGTKRLCPIQHFCVQSGETLQQTMHSNLLWPCQPAADVCNQEAVH